MSVEFLILNCVCVARVPVSEVCSCVFRVDRVEKSSKITYRLKVEGWILTDGNNEKFFDTLSEAMSFFAEGVRALVATVMQGAH